MLMSGCRCHRPSLCLPLSQLASFTCRCHGSLTPCEQSHRISPERQLKCQHCSRHCHVGLGEKRVGVVVVVVGEGLCHLVLEMCVSTTRLVETHAETVA